MKRLSYFFGASKSITTRLKTLAPFGLAIALGSIWGSFGLRFHYLGVQKRPVTKDGAGKFPGQKKVNFRSPHRPIPSFPF